MKVRKSKIILSEHYFEYILKGYGNRVHCYPFSNVGAKVSVEIILNNQIVMQKIIIMSGDGSNILELGQPINCSVIIRFKTLDKFSIVKVLEIRKRKWAIFEKIFLAGFID